MPLNPQAGTERRASPRRSINLPAELELKDGSRIRACVEDFCAEGMYVTFAQDSYADIESKGSVVGESLRVYFAINTPPQMHQINLQVRRLVRGGVGGMFVGDCAAALTAMIAVCSRQEKTGKEARNQQSVSLVIRRCERILLEHLEPLITEYLRHLPPAFEEAIEQASSDNAKTAFIEARGALIENASEFRARFLKQISDDVLAREGEEGSSGHGSREINHDNLALVDKQVFEDWLSLKVLITKAEAKYHDVLLQLTMRLDSMGLHGGKGQGNPLGPPLICHAWRDTLVALNFPAPVERVCLNLFEQEVAQRLDGLYQELNQLMVKAGVMPELDKGRFFKKPSPARENPETDPHKPKSETVSLSTEPPAASPFVPPELPSTPEPATSDSSVLAQTRPAHERTERPAELSEVPSEQQAVSRTQGAGRPSLSTGIQSDLSSAAASLQAAQNLFSLLRQGGGNADVGQRHFPHLEEAPAYSNREVLDNLQEVQTIPTAIGEDRALLDSGTLRARMHSLLRHRQESLKALSEQQDHALDVVDRFFSSVVNNPKITDVAKAQIKSLELPVLKLYLRDPNFFEDVEAVPRQVINRIAQLGMKGGRSPKAFIDRINQHVTRIQAEYDDDPSVFEEVLGDLDTMLERQNLLYRRNVERVAAAAEGQQKIAAAKKAVKEALNSRLAGRRVPKALMTLINGGWRDLLSLCFIRFGAESREWSDYLRVIDELLSVAQDASYPINLPEVLGVIQEGLASISSNQIPSGHIRLELKRFLTESSHGNWEAEDIPVVEDTDGAEDDPDIRQVQDTKRRGLQRWIHRAQRLQPGDWLRMDKEDKDPDFIRLVWVGHNQSRYVFVNHQGMKVIDVDAVTLAAYLQKGVATVEQEPERTLVDESLDEMVKSLYEQLSFVSTHDELTGMLQRKEFERQLNLFLDANPENVDLSIILVSLRQFRFINDSLGLEAGDKALKDIGRILRSLVTGDTRLCRYGGDEFMLQVEAPGESTVAEIERALKHYRLNWDDSSMTVAACIGYVDVPAGAHNVLELMNAAENACREARTADGSPVCGYDLNEKLLARRDAIASQVAELDRRQADEKILLRCQKIIPLHGKTRTGTQYEILLSVYDGTGNLIPAGEFVRAAEDYQRMQMVDRWVVGHVLEWMKGNRQQIEAMGGVCINLSGHSLNDQQLLEFIFERLTQYDVPMDKICFEITEAAVISNTQEVGEFIQELQEYGCRFCLGNFGSGISYQLLKSLPVDMIKIDATYMRDLATDINDQKIVRSMTEMAHYLGREIIAAYVESKEVLDIAKELGADYVQGFHVERPKSLSNF